MYPGLAGNKYILLEEMKLVNVMIFPPVAKVKNILSGVCVCVENRSANSGPF
jgi:hypothetical protein